MQEERDEQKRALVFITYKSCNLESNGGDCLQIFTVCDKCLLTLQKSVQRRLHKVYLADRQTERHGLPSRASVCTKRGVTEVG